MASKVVRAPFAAERMRPGAASMVLSLSLGLPIFRASVGSDFSSPGVRGGPSWARAPRENDSASRTTAAVFLMAWPPSAADIGVSMIFGIASKSNLLPIGQS
jgi:hypothetical protein